MSGVVEGRGFLEGDPRRPSTIQGKRPGKPGYTEEEAPPETDKYAGLGIGVANLLAENLACHPFIILRRQCQVNVESARAHTTPFTLVPVFVNLYRWQGVGVLWKGIGSSLTIRGLSLGMEDCISKVTPWPKEVDRHSSLRMIGQHLLLKSVSTALITPFYSASLVETVQSDIASEKPGVLDVFRDGVVRLLSWSDPRCGRMLPVWLLIPPQVIHSLAHYTISTVVQGLWLQVLKAAHREFQRLRGAISRDPQLTNLPGLSQYQEQAAALAGHLAADTLLFPLETVLHRLHLQGTRSIIDNLDTGSSVVPILTRYEGVADCFSTILQEEGFTGLFKGFGAMLLQFGVHFLIIKFSSQMISQVAQLISSPPRLPFPDPRQEPQEGAGAERSQEPGPQPRVQAPGPQPRGQEPGPQSRSMDNRDSMGPLNQGLMRGQELLDMGQELLGLQARGQEVVGPPVVEVLGEGLDLHPASRSPKPYRRVVPVEHLEDPLTPRRAPPSTLHYGGDLPPMAPRGGGFPSLLSFSSPPGGAPTMAPPSHLLPEPEPGLDPRAWGAGGRQDS